MMFVRMMVFSRLFFLAAGGCGLLLALAMDQFTALGAFQCLLI